MKRSYSTSVAGANYVLHIPCGERTLCGRLTKSVNCAAYALYDSAEICGACAKKRNVLRPLVVTSDLFEATISTGSAQVFVLVVGLQDGLQLDAEEC